MENAEYCVILSEGENAGKEQYFLISQERIQDIFNRYKFDADGKTSAKLSHIAGQKKGDTEDELKIDKKNGLLEFKCQNETTANKCAKYFKLPPPFPDAN